MRTLVTVLVLVAFCGAVVFAFWAWRDSVNDDAAARWNRLSAVEQRAAYRHDPEQTRAFMDLVDVELKPLP